MHRSKGENGTQESFSLKRTTEPDIGISIHARLNLNNVGTVYLREEAPEFGGEKLEVVLVDRGFQPHDGQVLIGPGVAASEVHLLMN
jgi:hypothetical protein